MILIDTNALIVLILGLIDTSLISTDKRTSIYTEKDFYKLLIAIQNFERLLILPNIWTEVDNLLNRITGESKYHYISKLKLLTAKSSEVYIETKLGIDRDVFWNLGLTDTLILELGKECDFIITSDSALSDYARANGIKVYDMVLERNKNL